MILRRIRVEHFRQHNLPVEIAFNDRLTVVNGPNEAGKSTLFTALQYVLFRRSSATGKDVDALAPWNTSGLASKVVLDFEHDGREYRLEKNWGKRSVTKLSLQNASGVFEPRMEDDADDFLATVFCGQIQRAGAFSGFNAQQMGLAYLLFVPQSAVPIAGDAKDIALSTNAQSRLTDIVGAAAQSPQEARIAEQITSAYDERFKQNGERRKLRGMPILGDEIRRVEAVLAIAREALASFVALADRVEEAQATSASAVARSIAARAAEAAALPRYRAAIDFKTACDAAQAHVERATDTYLKVAAQSQRYEAGRMRLAELAPARLTLEAAAAHAQTSCSTASGARVAAVAAFTAANAADAELDSLVAEFARAQVLEKSRVHLEDLVARTEAVENLDARLLAIEARLQTIGVVTDADVAALAEAIDRVRDLRTKLDAAQTTVAVTAESTVALRWSAAADGGEATLATGERFERRASGELTVTFPGFATVTVCGPVTDAAALEAELVSAESALASLRGLRGTESAFDLHRLVLEREELIRDRAMMTAQRDERLAGATLEARRDEINDARRSIASAPPCASIEALESQISERRLERNARIDACSLVVEEAHATENAAIAALQKARTEFQAASAEYDRATRDVAELEAQYATPALCTAALDAAYAGKHEAGQRLKAATDAYEPYREEGDPLSLFTASQDAARSSQEAEHEAKLALQTLQDRLQSGYVDAPAAVVSDLEAELDGLRIQFEEEQLEDRALKVLHAFVTGASAERVAQFAKPVLERVGPWFAEVTGNRLAGLDLGEHNELGTFRLEGVDRPVRFDELSKGTADQLGLLIRLAFASLLTAPGRLGRMPVVFDDPLVNADPFRRERFKTILKDVSETAQVIVFTCRPEDYADFGGPAVTLGASAIPPEAGGTQLGSSEAA